MKLSTPCDVNVTVHHMLYFHPFAKTSIVMASTILRSHPLMQTKETQLLKEQFYYENSTTPNINI